MEIWEVKINVEGITGSAGGVESDSRTPSNRVIYSVKLARLRGMEGAISYNGTLCGSIGGKLSRLINTPIFAAGSACLVTRLNGL